MGLLSCGTLLAYTLPFPHSQNRLNGLYLPFKLNLPVFAHLTTASFMNNHPVHAAAFTGQ